MGTKVINFVNPTKTVEAYTMLVHCTFSGYGFKQTSDLLAEIGYKLSYKQYEAFQTVCDEMVALDVKDFLGTAEG